MIKKIYAFGTSHTAGGGFEFNTLTNNYRNPEVYKKIIKSQNHYDFSYPNMLGKLLDIKVENRAKQGYGYEKVSREIFDVLCSSDFDSKSSLFLIETSGWDRQEFWFNDINDYISINSQSSKIKDPNSISIANDYHFQDDSTTHKILESKSIFDKFIQKTSNLDYLVRKVQINFFFLINLLENQNIKYYLTNGDIPLPPDLEKYINYKNNIVNYDLYDLNKKENQSVQNWTEKVFSFGLTISEECSNKVNDNHQGLSVSKTISETIYNKMIDDGLIDREKLNINFIENWNHIKNMVSSII